MNRDVVEDGGCISEDEIHTTGDVAIGVVLTAEIREESVLISEETAMLEDGFVRTHGDGDGLSGCASGVREGYAICVELWRLHVNRFGEKGSSGTFRILCCGDDDARWI